MVDLSVLQSSPEALAAQANWATLMSTILIQDSNYEFLRDQNDFSSKASKMGANATMASHNQQAYQFQLQAAEAFVQGGSMAGIMATSHFVAGQKFDEPIQQAQNKANASQTYMNEASQRLENSRNKVVVKTGAEAAQAAKPTIARTAQQEAQIRRINNRSADDINDLVRDDNGNLTLNAADKQAMDVMNDVELEALKTKAQAANKKANKSVESLTSQKQQLIQQWNQIQQMVGYFGSGVTKSMSAASESIRAKQEYLRSLLQWIQEGMQTANQISNTAIGQQNERMSGVINTMSAEVQANKAN